MSRTDEEKAEGLDQNDDITSSIRVKESGGSRVRPNDARGRRQPQSQMACAYMPTLERLKAVGEGLFFQVQKDAKCCILLHFGYKICVVEI
jgi:hypothetical protein